MQAKIKADFSDSALKKIYQIAEYEFDNLSLLTQSLTHASYKEVSSVNRTENNYERLEFLGDRVLGVLVAHMLYKIFPFAKEGELSKRLNALVNADLCADILQQCGLAQFVRTSEELKRSSTKPYKNIYADVMEAFIAALYLDGGFEVAEKFVYKYWEKLASQDIFVRSDAKTSLQEWAHQVSSSQPVYNLIKREGSEHDPKFYIEVVVKGYKPVLGIGSSKRKAQTDAASKMLYKQGVWV